MFFSKLEQSLKRDSPTSGPPMVEGMSLGTCHRHGLIEGPNFKRLGRITKRLAFCFLGFPRKCSLGTLSPNWNGKQGEGF